MLFFADDAVVQTMLLMAAGFAGLAAVWQRATSTNQEDEAERASHVPTGLLNYVDGAVLVVDNTYRVQHFNDQVHGLFPEHRIEQGAALPRAFVDKLPAPGEYATVWWPSGADTALRVHVKAVRGPSGVSRVLTLRDVTEATEQEAKLRSTDRLLRAILETDVAAVAVVNEQGSVTYANAQAESLLGLQRTEEGTDANGVGAWRYKQLGWQMEPLDAERAIPTPLRDVLDTGEPIRDFRCKVIWPGGSYQYLSLNAAPLPVDAPRAPQVVFAMKDITTRYRVRQELLAKLRRRDATRDAMPAFFYMTDHSGHTRTWNDRMREYTGYTDDELAGSALPRLFHPDDRLRIRKAVKTAFAEGKEFGENMRLQAKDGTLRSCVLKGAVRTIDGTDYLIIVGLDVSAQKGA